MRIKLKDSTKIVISLLLVIAVMVMIFVFSSQTVDDSDGLSGQITKIAVKVYIFIMDRFRTVTNDGGRLMEGNGLFADMNHYVRKLAHVMEFSLLGAALMLHCRAGKNITKRPFTRSCLIPVTCIGCFYAATDEFHQFFVEGRGPQIKDVVIDTAGVIIGSTLVIIIICYVNKRKGCNEHERQTQNG